MASMPWVKIYTEFIDDPKMGALPESAKLRCIQLIILAGECDADGMLVAGDQPMTVEMIAWRLRISPDQLASDIAALVKCGVLADSDGVIELVNFDKRQGRSQGDKQHQWKAHQAVRREKVRDGVYERSHGKCEYCHKAVQADLFVVDHVVPPFRGGSYTAMQNLACACISCNKKKGEKTPEELGWVNPRDDSPKVSDDFEDVNDDAAKVIIVEREEIREEKIKNPLSPANDQKEPEPETATAIYVSVFGELIKTKPNDEQIRLMQAVTDCAKWRAVLLDWKAHKWQPSNVPGMLDKYTNGDKARRPIQVSNWPRGRGGGGKILRADLQCQEATDEERKAAQERARQRNAEREARKAAKAGAA